MRPRPKGSRSGRTSDRAVEDELDEQYKTPANLQARAQLHQRFSTSTIPWFEWVFDHFRLGKQARILEIGCGHGLLWQQRTAGNGPGAPSRIAPLPAGWRVTLTDRSAGMVSHAARNLAIDGPTHSRQYPSQFTFALANAEALPFAPGMFDAVVANHMLYHVSNRAAALGEIHRVLRPGGRLYAATNDQNHMHEIFELAETYLQEHPSTLEEIDAALAREDQLRPQGEGPPSARFTFAQGHSELAQHFRQIQLHRYYNRLVVTDADALADYMLSGMFAPRRFASEEAQEALRDWLREQIRPQGAITITPMVGLFEAQKA